MEVSLVDGQRRLPRINYPLQSLAGKLPKDGGAQKGSGGSQKQMQAIKWKGPEYHFISGTGVGATNADGREYSRSVLEGTQ